MKLLALVLVPVLLPLVAFAQATPEDLQGMFMVALKANDADAVARLYTADAAYFPVGGSLSAPGADGVRESWAAFFAENHVHNVKLRDSGGTVEGDLAVAWGIWVMTFHPAGGGHHGDAATMEGRYLDVARKIDGKWRYVADHASVPYVPPATHEKHD